ncbi:MAG: hypothetical protein WBC78_15465, partial [Candidatus Sulfotelmatobacter sp.]
MFVPSPRIAAAIKQAALLLTAFALVAGPLQQLLLQAQEVPAAPAPQAAPAPAQPQLVHLQ